jgi:hypothetical protein
MAKRRAPHSHGKGPGPAGEQSALSERMRELILRSTAEERRNPGAGDGTGAVGKRRRRTDDNSNEPES